MEVPAARITDIVGEKGSIVRKIKDEFHVEITIPESKGQGKGKNSDEKIKITLAGADDTVEAAKEVIHEIVEFFHSDLTHPGFIHETIEFDSRLRGVLIGKGGKEIRDIQE